MSHFTFLQTEWPAIYHSAERAESLINADPRAGCFYARRTLEMAVQWVYQADRTLVLPYQDHLSALIHESSFVNAAGDAVFSKAKLIVRLGNEAVHSSRLIRPAESMTAVRELFHVCYWLARTYARGRKPPADLKFDTLKVPSGAPTISGVPQKTVEQLQKLEADVTAKDQTLATLRKDKESLDEQIKQLRAEVAEAKKANEARPDTHDYSEAQTRDDFIDQLLREAGWWLEEEKDREFPVDGMPTPSGKGRVDYLLWGDDGLPLAVVEAKRTKVNAEAGKHQAKLYADSLEKRYGRRPIIYYTNGYEHWLWDDAMYPPRPVQGFAKKLELEQMIGRRGTRKSLAEASINNSIIERYYQTRAIRRVGDSFERDKRRKALLVMATGAGKTRTVVALCDLLMRCNWAGRILFLADRVALVRQAVNVFKKFLPDASPVNLVTEKAATGKVYVCTYPTMMGLIDEASDDERRFGVGHFDVIIIDEAHRSVYQKYKAIFEYFDSLLVGLTATPTDDIDRNTFDLFDVEDGVPTDAYPLADAVKDGYLVPATPVSVPLKFARQGIKYADLTDEEKEQWDEKEWGEDEADRPDAVDASAVNKWLFNTDTVDKVLKHLMMRGQKVAGGDRLAKTIVFAKNRDHANFIAERFDKNFRHLKGEFAQVITYETTYAQSLIDDFSKPAKMPHIAISVDMLDTGIDVPEVANLVFFKLVHSKTKFWQMVGRGTRLSPNLFGPGDDKKFFYIFDYCGNLEFFGQDPATSGGAVAESLSKRLFKTRLELVTVLDARGPDQPTEEKDLRQETVTGLLTEVAAMNVDNFVVRPHRRAVEKFANPDGWKTLDANAMTELAQEVAGLPAELPFEDEDAKRFDLLMLNLQLAVLRVEPAYERLKGQVQALMGALEEKAAVPMVRPHLPLIEEMQTEAWWTDVTVPMLENARKKLRLLVRLIEKTRRDPVFTAFTDEMSDEVNIPLRGLQTPADHEKFLAKARSFLWQHQADPVIKKLRTNQALTAADVQGLEKIFSESGLDANRTAELAAKSKEGLPRFVRSLVGMDRQTATAAMSGFMAGRSLTANQIEFLNLIVDHLVEHGMVEPAKFYASPFIDISAQGPDGLFEPLQLTALFAAVNGANAIRYAAM